MSFSSRGIGGHSSNHQKQFTHTKNPGFSRVPSGFGIALDSLVRSISHPRLRDPEDLSARYHSIPTSSMSSSGHRPSLSEALLTDSESSGPGCTLGRPKDSRQLHSSHLSLIPTT